MKFKGISVNEALKEAESLLKKDKSLSPAIKATIKMLIMLVTILANRLNINSRNSGKPPSEDKKRKRGSKNDKSKKKPGGQNGHVGTRLKKVATPDKIKQLKIDRRTLPKGKYKVVGFESRQVFDIKISREVTEFRAEVLEDQNGNRYVAEFPSHVGKDVQYGVGAKATAVYMSQFQLIPYDRVREQFAEQMHLPLSTGTLFNFNKAAYRALADYDEIAKQQLIQAKQAHSDETGIQVGKKRIWLHTVCNSSWTYYYPHKKRGSEAMDEIGILPNFKGILCHDHWKPYYSYSCTHALCNAHHKRELIYAEEQDNQEWAKKMKELLAEINKAVDKAGGKLSKSESERYRKKYRKILRAAEIECPEPKRKKNKNKRGRPKKSKSRNLLERLIKFEDDVLRFMDNKIVPYTNNLGEADLRMTKVQQKISGCFRSIEGAYIFCRIRGYISTCRKHGVHATEALRLLFEGRLPDFLEKLMGKH
jgi:transposase